MENEDNNFKTNEIKEVNEEVHLSKGERRRLKRLQIKEDRQKERSQSARSSVIKKVFFAVIAVIIISGLGFLFYKMGTGPNYDSFAQCLASKDAVIYGNNWCSYTQEQKKMFGSSFQYLNYKVCDENRQLCNENGVSITPTWEINGKIYSGIQSFGTLSQASGCSLGK